MKVVELKRKPAGQVIQALTLVSQTVGEAHLMQ